MKVRVPIAKANPCECDIDTFLIFLDEWGIERIECPLHGPPLSIDYIEFDNEEEYERWKSERSNS